jgi:hypothetical protein
MKLKSSAVFLIRTNSKSVTLHRKLHGFKTERSGGGQSPAFDGGPDRERVLRGGLNPSATPKRPRLQLKKKPL